jgi:hypothetical protein
MEEADMQIAKRMDCVGLLTIGAALCLTLLPAVTHGKEVKVGAATIVLPAPSGYCELDESHSVDNGAIAITERMLRETRLLAFSADCEQLADHRATKGVTPLDNLAQYQTPLSWEGRPLPGAPEGIVKSVCQLMRANNDRLVLATASEMKVRAKQVLENVKVNEVQSIGVVGEETLACYVAFLKKFAIGDTEKTQVVVLAVTVVSSKLLYYYLYSPYVASETITDQLKQVRENVAALLSANR